MLDGEPSGIDPFGTVEGRAVGHTFAPAGDAVALGADKQDTAIIDPAKAGLKEIDERPFDFMKGESFDFQSCELVKFLLTTEDMECTEKTLA